MGLTSSLYTGLSGLIANAELISISGNNIANVNTAGYKAQRLSFETQIAQLLSAGSAPTAELGGTNPMQIGLGVRLGSTTRNFNTGNITSTGVNTDLAIDGNGFFVVDYGGIRRYTRAGTFTLDREFALTYNGGRVQGYGVDSDFNILEGVLTDIIVPLGDLTIAEATRNIRIGGNLNAGGNVATRGSLITSAPLYADPLCTIPATAATDLTSLYNASGLQLFATGDVLTFSGATKGSAELPSHTFEVGPTNTTGADANGTTLGDLLTFLEGVLGIDTSVGGAGITVSPAGEILIQGNTGTANDLVLESANLVKNALTSPSQPFQFTKLQSADGESVRTSFIAYDSLGNQMTIELTIVLENKAVSGPQWRFYIQSDDDDGISRVLGNGTLAFDNYGNLASVMNNTFSIFRSTHGAASPQAITLQFASDQGRVSSLADVTSQVSSLYQDGLAKGTLQDFQVASDGRVVGIFSNNALRDLGQIVLASFTNPQGLIDLGGNLFAESVNSGSAQIFKPATGSVGKVLGGFTELSNVELSQEFINLITASTGFSAASRVLSTSDRLIQELLATLR